MKQPNQNEEELPQIAFTRDESEKIQQIAASTGAGIWRIKRAKILLGFVNGRTVEQLVLDVRVVPESIRKCVRRFSTERMKFFEKPGREPTGREASSERVLTFLNNPPPPGSKKWDKVKCHYYGRDFSAREIQEIRDLIAARPGARRAEIAREICLKYELVQMNGNLKKTAASIMLKRMDMDNMIQIKTAPAKKHGRNKRKPFVIEQRKEDLVLSGSDLKHLQFIPVCHSKDAEIWNAIIRDYHYIPACNLWGAQMKYLVYGGKNQTTKAGSGGCKSQNNFGKPNAEISFEDWKARHLSRPREEHLLGALGFAAGSWHLKNRDEFIGWTDEQRAANLQFVANNSRFHILPWIRSKNLASRILGGIARQLPYDWKARYGYSPVLLETFVLLEKYKGTCYRAANWIQIGITKGYGVGKEEKARNSRAKAVFLYPLDRNFREILCSNINKSPAT